MHMFDLFDLKPPFAVIVLVISKLDYIFFNSKFVHHFKNAQEEEDKWVVCHLFQIYLSMSNAKTHY